MHVDRALPRTAEAAARITFALMAAGMAGRAFLGDDAVFGVLWSPPPDGADRSEELARAVSVGGALFMLVAALALLVPRTRVPLVPIAVWTLLLMLAAFVREPFRAWLVPGEKAARWLAPIALLLWLPATRFTRWLPSRPGLAEALLRVAAAATFAFHGLKALIPEPHFLDLLFSGSDRLAGLELSQDAAESVLVAIGVVDLAVAVLVLVVRLPAVAAWMVFWGAITAMSRVVHAGLGAWPETLLRAPNAGVPAILLLTWVAWQREAAARERRTLGAGGHENRAEPTTT